MATALIPAFIDKESQGNWIATTPTGLFASGEDFVGARKALADLIIEMDQARTEALAFECVGEGDEEITAVRILATTRKTFPIK